LTLLTAEITESSRQSVLCWLATADADGMPNVSPKEIFAVFDDEHLVIAHIASPQSAANITANAKVCVSFVDVFAQKGFKLTGHATLVPAGTPAFAHWAAPLEKLAGPRFPIRSDFVVKVLATAPIVAPSYWLFPQEATPQRQVESAMRTYGVRPANT
jgi:predicted pyridoxine 5'-phosphate oxidase superfamily flavin-nucleotide-binding protein